MVDTTAPKGSISPLLPPKVEAGAPEIEVTASMIDAGVQCFYRHDPREDNIEEILPDVFRAMCAAKKSESA
jgi:hypothetical protein